MATPQLALITLLSQPVAVACDARCDKAWGTHTRPRRPGTHDFVSDDELGTAPADPGTWEGNDRKPASPADFPNRWCVRECERCVVAGHREGPVQLPEFTQRALERVHQERTCFAGCAHWRGTGYGCQAMRSPNIWDWIKKNRTYTGGSYDVRVGATPCPGFEQRPGFEPVEVSDG